MIRTKSVEFMPFYLSLSTFLMSISFFAYGMFKCDAFIYVSIFYPSNGFSLRKKIKTNNLWFSYNHFLLVSLLYELQVPNGIGTVLGAVQLMLYSYYSRTSREDSREHLIVSYAWRMLYGIKGNGAFQLTLLQIHNSFIGLLFGVLYYLRHGDVGNWIP